VVGWDAARAGTASLDGVGRTHTAEPGSRKRCQLTTPGYRPGYQYTQVNSSSGEPALGSTIELWIPASAAHIPTVRTVAADLAGRQDFDLDGIHDFRMAVDEACAQLVALATIGTPLRCVFVVSHEHIDVTAKVSVIAPIPLRTNTFGWQVLTTLTDLVEPINDLAPDPIDDRAVPEVGIRLRVSRDRTTGA
jgi:serine/threonine-protein kinase RsbW